MYVGKKVKMIYYTFKSYLKSSEIEATLFNQLCLQTRMRYPLVLFNRLED